MFSIARRFYDRALWRAYRQIFKAESKAAALVLDDLAHFCHAKAKQTTACYDNYGRIDPIATQQLEGRRQVFLRIVAAMNEEPQDFTQQRVEIYEDVDD